MYSFSDTKTKVQGTSLILGGADSTVYNMNFNWGTAAQIAILAQLQKGGYKLMAYKGASGPQLVTAGLPTWFAQPFSTMFGVTNIDYIPKYKVYLYSKATIGADTTIQMDALSNEVGLGSIVTFDQTGQFSVTSGAPAGTITAHNNQSAGSNNLTVGLAAKVNGEFLPFCAFTSLPQNSVNMQPNEKVVLFAAQTGLVSGSVSAASTAPGCTFEFNAASISYALEMIASTLGITTRPPHFPSVTETTSGANLAQLLNN